MNSQEIRHKIEVNLADDPEPHDAKFATTKGISWKDEEWKKIREAELGSQTEYEQKAEHNVEGVS